MGEEDFVLFFTYQAFIYESADEDENKVFIASLRESSVGEENFVLFFTFARLRLARFMKKIILIGILVLILTVVGFSVWKYKFVGDKGNIPEKQNLIRVNEPLPNVLVQSPLKIAGEARGYWFFEASFPVRLVDEKGRELGRGIAQALSDWMTEDFVPFETTLEFQFSTTKKGTLILEKDNPSGLPENADELRIPVRFNLVETIKVKAYFNNDKMDPEFSCNKVFPVEREVPKTQAVAGAALEELLKGSTDAEKEQGFFTSINPDVKIQKLSIEDEIAKVDFDEQLEFQVGGSCRVAAIRAQITETLKQFPTVKDVIISIDGRTEDILQP